MMFILGSIIILGINLHLEFGEPLENKIVHQGIITVILRTKIIIMALKHNLFILKLPLR